MNIEETREFCLSIKGAEESLPFDDTTLVFKVMNKMFAYMPLNADEGIFKISLKCDPEKAIELREKYSGVIPGYHSNKKYWNTVSLNTGIPDDKIKYWIEHSVEEVLKKLPRKQQEIYEQL